MIIEKWLVVGEKTNLDGFNLLIEKIDNASYRGQSGGIHKYIFIISVDQVSEIKEIAKASSIELTFHKIFIY